MAKIDTSRDFTKYAGSVRRAKIIIIKALEKQGLPAHFGTYTTRMYRQRIDSVRGSIEGILEWSYNGNNKCVSVEYIDGRPKSEEKEKPEFYVVWIEGLEPIKGEKILSLDRSNHEYTLSMTRAMRVLPMHIEMVKSLLKEQGVSRWALDNCMVRVNYAPSGTVFNPDKL